MEAFFSRILFILLLFVLPGHSTAIDNRIPGARSAALSQAVAALPGNEALFHNQAGITSVTDPTISLSYESVFLLKELSLMSIGVIIPTGKGTFGGMFYQFGTGLYREDKAGIVYSKKWDQKLSASLQFDYFSQLLPENRDPIYTITFESGLLYGEPGHWLWGIHVFNPVKAGMKYLSGKEPLPMILRAGYSWFVSPWLMNCCEIEKTGKQPFRLKTGIEFSPDPLFMIRAGVSGTPVKFSAGAGFRVGKLTFGLAFSYHGNLGYTPSVGLQISP